MTLGGKKTKTSKSEIIYNGNISQGWIRKAQGYNVWEFGGTVSVVLNLHLTSSWTNKTELHRIDASFEGRVAAGGTKGWFKFDWDGSSIGESGGMRHTPIVRYFKIEVGPKDFPVAFPPVPTG